MEFFVEQAVLDAGVKIVFAKVCGLDNHGEDPEWAAYRDKRLEELFEEYAELDVTSSSCSRRTTVCSTSTRRWISIT